MRGPSLCAVPATHLGQHHPRAAVLMPWPGGPAGGPWRAGRKRPVQQHRKPWPLERTRTYRPWTEGVDYPSRRQRLAGKAAWQWMAMAMGDLHIPLGRSTVEGGEDGGGTRPVSGRKRCLPRPSHLCDGENGDFIVISTTSDVDLQDLASASHHFI